MNKLIKNSNKDNIKVEVVYNEELSAPIFKNDVVGYIKIKYNEKDFDEFKIFSQENVEKIDYSFCFFNLLKQCFVL